MMKASPKRSRNLTGSMISPGREPAAASFCDDSIGSLQKEVQKLQFTVGDRDVEIERMKTTLFSLNGKLSKLEDVQKESGQHKSSFQTSETKRVTLQTEFTSISKKVIQDTQEHETTHTRHIDEIEQLRTQIRELRAEMAQSELLARDELNCEHEQFQKKLNEKDSLQKRMEIEFNELTLEQEQAHLNKIKEMQDQFSKRFDGGDTEHQEEISALEDDMERLEQDLTQRAREQQSHHEKDVERLTREAQSKLKRVSEEHASEVKSLKETQKQKEAHHRQTVEQMRHDFKTMLSELQQNHDSENRSREENYSEQIRVRIRMQEESESNLKDKLEALRSQKDNTIKELQQRLDEMRYDFEGKVDEMTVTIETMEKQILVQNSTITALEADLYRKRDIEQQLQEALHREKEGQIAREHIQTELENATDYILELEEKVYKANKTSLELLKQLKNAESELETLKQYIIDLKHRIAVYIPVKDDQVDRRLAEFINNYPERQKLKIMFMRESEGVYQFGTKRVAVKVEHDSIKIRVGGGYLSLDEFLDQYTPVEMERLDRKDPVKRFSEKVAVQKTCVNQAIREKSPIRQKSPLRSPVRSPGKVAASFRNSQSPDNLSQSASPTRSSRKVIRSRQYQ